MYFAKLIAPLPAPHPPATLRLAAAQLLGMIGFVLSLVISLLLTPLVSSSLFDFLGVRGEDFVIKGLFSTLAGVGVSLLEWLILRRWTPRRWVWVSACIIILWVLFPCAFALVDHTALKLPAGFTGLDEARQAQIAQVMYNLVGIAGAAIGIAFGLVCGVFQSLLLTGGRRRWWLLNAIAWAFIWAAIAAFGVYISVSFAGIFL